MWRIVYMMVLAVCYGFSIGFFSVRTLNYFNVELPSFLHEAAIAIDKPSPDKIIPSDWVLTPYSKK